MKGRNPPASAPRAEDEPAPPGDASAAERGDGPGRRAGSGQDRRSGDDVFLCDLCGAPMLNLHCKLLCRRCGYRRDCSDP